MRAQSRFLFPPLVFLACVLPALASAQQRSDPAAAVTQPAPKPAAGDAQDPKSIMTVRDYCVHLDRDIPKSLREATSPGRSAGAAEQRGDAAGARAAGTVSDEVKSKAGLWNSLNCAQVVYGPGAHARPSAPGATSKPDSSHRYPGF